MVVGVVALHAESVAELVGTDEVGYLEVHVEAANLAVFLVGGAVVEGDVVVGPCYGAVEDGGGAGDEGEVGAEAVVLPVVVGEGLVADDLIVEAETEEVDLAAGAAVDG